MAMHNKSQGQINSKTTEIPSSEPNAQQNPRKAATKAKQAHLNLDMMRRRLMVLHGHEDYNRYRTLDHQKRINRHSEIHQKMLKQKQGLRKSLEKVNDKSWVKQKCEQIREQLKVKLKQAKKGLLEQKTDRSHIINEQSHENDEKIKQSMLKSYQENKQRRKSIVSYQQQSRESVSRHVNDRIRKIKWNKTVDSESLNKKAGQGEQQYSRLVEYEQQLIKKNSQSLQVSQVMKRKFNDIFTTATTKNNKILPQIRSRTNNSKQTNSSDIPLV